MSWQTKFRVLRVLGRGGYGVVYLCSFRDPKLARRHGKVAVKRIWCQSLEDANASMKEIHTIVNIDCPNIIKYIDCFLDSEAPAKPSPGLTNVFVDDSPARYCVNIVMQFCNSGDLGEVLKINEHVAEEFIVNLLFQMSTALEHLHSRGICHRDISPRNIMIFMSEEEEEEEEEEENGDQSPLRNGISDRPRKSPLTPSGDSTELFMAPLDLLKREIVFKLVDFGCVRRFHDTVVKTIVGTPFYWSPEILTFQSAKSPRRTSGGRGAQASPFDSPTGPGPLSPFGDETEDATEDEGDGYDASKMDIFSLGAVVFNLMLGKEVSVHTTLLQEGWGRAEKFFQRKGYSSGLLRVLREMLAVDIRERISAVDLRARMKSMRSNLTFRTLMSQILDGSFELFIQIITFLPWRDAIRCFGNGEMSKAMHSLWKKHEEWLFREFYVSEFKVRMDERRYCSLWTESRRNSRKRKEYEMSRRSVRLADGGNLNRSNERVDGDHDSDQSDGFVGWPVLFKTRLGIQMKYLSDLSVPSEMTVSVPVTVSTTDMSSGVHTVAAAQEFASATNGALAERRLKHLEKVAQSLFAITTADRDEKRWCLIFSYEIFTYLHSQKTVGVEKAKLLKLMSLILSKLHLTGEAIDCIREAVAIAPLNDAYHYVLGRYLKIQMVMSPTLDEALCRDLDGVFSTLMRLKPDNETFLWEYALFLDAWNTKLFRQMDLTESNEDSVRVRKVYDELEARYLKAVEVLSTLLTINSEDIMSVCRIAEIYAILFNAISRCQKVMKMNEETLLEKLELIETEFQVHFRRCLELNEYFHKAYATFCDYVVSKMGFLCRTLSETACLEYCLERVQQMHPWLDQFHYVKEVDAEKFDVFSTTISILTMTIVQIIMNQIRSLEDAKNPSLSVADRVSLASLTRRKDLEVKRCAEYLALCPIEKRRLYNQACLYSIIGDVGRAKKYMLVGVHKYFNQRPFAYPKMSKDVDLETLRQCGWFREVLERLRIVQREAMSGPKKQL